jgi:hypothetical protein
VAKDFKERKKKQKRKKLCKSNYIEYIYNNKSIYIEYISNRTPLVVYEP